MQMKLIDVYVYVSSTITKVSIVYHSQRIVTSSTTLGGLSAHLARGAPERGNMHITNKLFLIMNIM